MFDPFSVIAELSCKRSALEVLEPYAVKIARTVLRGG